MRPKAQEGRQAEDRALARLLRVLALDKSQACVSSPDGDKITIESIRGSFRFSAETFANAERRGLVRLDGEGCLITPDGISLLRRQRRRGDQDFAAQHVDSVPADIRLPDGTVEAVNVNANESPLGRLFLRKDRSGKGFLNRAQFAAGEKLRGDFERARIARSITMRWENTGPGGARRGIDGELSDMAIDARRRVELALGDLEDSLRGVTLDVCCFLKGLEQVERERRWPPRSAKLMLRTALSVLAVHYGFQARASGNRRFVLHWGDGNHRPSISPSVPTGER